MHKIKDLHIVVLLKQVPVPKAMKTKKDGMMDRSGASQINPYCDNALEEALKLRDKVGGDITVVSMGPPNAKQSLREAMRKGADKCILISDRLLAGSDTWATSLTLASAIKKYLPATNLIFAGLQTIDGDTANVGPEVAEHLSFNQVTYVEHIDAYEDHLLVKQQIEGGYQTMKAQLPLLLSITGEANTPRGPSLSASLRTSDDKITTYTVSEIGLTKNDVGLLGSPTVVSRVINVVIDRPPVVLFNEGDAEQRVDTLLTTLTEEIV